MPYHSVIRKVMHKNNKHLSDSTNIGYGRLIKTIHSNNDSIILLYRILHIIIGLKNPCKKLLVGTCQFTIS